MARKCVSCGTQGSLLSSTGFQEIQGKDYCTSCAGKFVENAIANIVITTTNSFDGYFVKRYIDVESVEVVAGTSAFTEFGGDVADFFGTRASGFEKKLQKAKRTALDKLRYSAFEKGGNAVVGIDLDYTEFSGNKMGVIANGTIVEIVPYQNRQD